MKEFNILQTYEIFLKLIYLKLIQEYLNNENIGFTDETNAEEEKLFYTVTDIQGSITEVYDNDSNLVWKSGYTAFGELAGETVDLIDFDGMYTGCDYDAETGLTYHWNRWRSEDGSCFISEDPARDGANWYGYAGQNPMVYVDRIGLFYYTAEGQQSSTSNTPKTDTNDSSNKTPQNQTPNITGGGPTEEQTPPVPNVEADGENGNTDSDNEEFSILDLIDILDTIALGASNYLNDLGLETPGISKSIDEKGFVHYAQTVYDYDKLGKAEKLNKTSKLLLGFSIIVNVIDVLKVSAENPGTSGPTEKRLLRNTITIGVTYIASSVGAKLGEALGYSIGSNIGGAIGGAGGTAIVPGPGTAIGMTSGQAVGGAIGAGILGAVGSFGAAYGSGVLCDYIFEKKLGW